MEKFLGIFEDDWRRIPANYRFIFFAGFFLIIVAWIGDHWGNNVQYQVPVFESNQTAFRVGTALIAVFFGILVLKQARLWWKIQSLRRRYPFSKWNKEFYIVSDKVAVYLLDNEKMERFHLKNPQTVMDLDFWLLGWPTWPTLPEDMDPDVETPVKGITKKIRWNDYKENPSGIFTQF